MKRREFIALVASGATVCSLAASAQKGPVRIGFLSAGASNTPTAPAIVSEINEGLRENGMTEGRDYVLDVRYAAGRYEQFPDMARDLAKAGGRMILVNTIAAVRAAQAMKPPIPVVMISINDPVGTGLVASLARPGGLTTGMATLNDDLTPKILEFQRAIVPKAKKIAALFSPNNPTNRPMIDNLSAQAGALGMTIVPVMLRPPDGIETAFASLTAERPDALHLLADSANLDLGDRIAAFAIEHRLPLFATWTPITELGGLLAYGAPRRQLIIRAGYFVKRILDGANPGDLPVEQPTEVELWINMKTAKALGLDIPLNLRQLADQLIE
jgi:putative tryptophan/tyrosine transport system substrate-binding protein